MGLWQIFNIFSLKDTFYLLLNGKHRATTKSIFTMKAIIPVAGIGSRLRPHTHTQPKALIPVAGKPILAHIVDKLIAEGISDFVFVIGYMGDKIEEYIVQTYPKLNSTFVIQTSGKGIAHAIHLTKEHIHLEEELLIVLGDTIFEADLGKVLALKESAIGIKKVEDPRLFGVAELNKQGKVVKLVEKPLIPKTNLALVGVYYLNQAGPLLEAIQYIIDNKIKTQNEYHLTDALMYMVQKGSVIGTFEVDNWFDCGKKEILLQTNTLLLKRLGEEQNTNHILEHSIIIPPVYIGENAVIRHSVIGPNVSIGNDTHIESSIICNSIIGPHAHIGQAVLKDSLIGNDASLKGMVHTLNLGDSAEINFS